MKAIVVRLPEELLALIDALADSYDMSRERAIRLALAGTDEATLLRGFVKMPTLEKTS